MQEHNYVKKVEAFVAKHNIERGKVHEIQVLHDDWCGVFKGRRCNCNPEIRYAGIIGDPRKN